MAPAPVATANRPMAAPSKIRYFKGKAPDAALSDSDSDEAEVEQKPQPTKTDKRLMAGGAGRVLQEGAKMKVALRDVKVEGGRVLLPKVAKQEEESEEESEEDDDEEEEEEEMAKPRPTIPKPPGSEESSEYETDSEEESEQEQKPSFRPVFVKKVARGMTQEKAAAEEEARMQEEEETQVQRKLDSKELAGETIRRELAERELVDLQPDVDDTDGLDPSVEFDAWRARELTRLLRDKQSQAERDEEQEEIERRRALPEEQRLREDMEYAAKTRERERGQMGFLQKYYHKGAFHQEDDILNRDYTAGTESAVDMTMLPQVMQVRDFGKRSRTKYTHLTDQDTSQGGWGTAARQAGQSFQGLQGGGQAPGQFQEGCWNCGGPHLRADCPNNDVNNPNGFGASEAERGQGTKANMSSLGQSRGWGSGGERNRDRYREEGREKRFEEERRSDRYGDRNGEGGRDRGDYRREGDDDRSRGYDKGRDRDRRERGRSRSPGRRKNDRYDRDDRDRRRDKIGDRERDRRRHD